MMRNISLLILLMLVIPSANAYLGPGLGAGTIGAALGVIGAVLLAIVGVFYYPIKRLLKKRKAGKEPSANTDTDTNNDGQ